MGVIHLTYSNDVLEDTKFLNWVDFNKLADSAYYTNVTGKINSPFKIYFKLFTRQTLKDLPFSYDNKHLFNPFFNHMHITFVDTQNKTHVFLLTHSEHVIYTLQNEGKNYRIKIPTFRLSNRDILGNDITQFISTIPYVFINDSYDALFRNTTYKDIDDLLYSFTMREYNKIVFSNMYEKLIININNPYAPRICVFEHFDGVNNKVMFELKNIDQLNVKTFNPNYETRLKKNTKIIY